MNRPPPIMPCRCCGQADRHYVGGVCGRHEHIADPHYWQSRCYAQEAALTSELIHERYLHNITKHKLATLTKGELK